MRLKKWNVILTIGVCAIGFTGCSSILGNVSTPPNAIKPVKQVVPSQKKTQEIDYKSVDSIDVLVNKTHPLPATYVPKNLVFDTNLTYTFTGRDPKGEMRPETALALEKMFADAKKAGISLAVVSAYRSYDFQKSLYNYYVQTQGAATASQYSAQPGTSEHQTGLAVDISGSNGLYQADPRFANSPEGKWLAANCQNYGFILRYLKGKESITGYDYEPWHIRYVGVDLAQKITQKGLTYEEYLGIK